MRCDSAQQLAPTLHARTLVPSVPFLLWLHSFLCYDSPLKDIVVDSVGARSLSDSEICEERTREEVRLVRSASVCYTHLCTHIHNILYKQWQNYYESLYATLEFVYHERIKRGESPE